MHMHFLFCCRPVCHRAPVCDGGREGGEGGEGGGLFVCLRVYNSVSLHLASPSSHCSRVDLSQASARQGVRPNKQQSRGDERRRQKRREEKEEELEEEEEEED